MQDTIDELYDLLVDLTAAGGQITRATDEDDLDLASLLMPLLRDLDRISLEYQIAQREHLPWHINVFDALAGGGSGLPISSLNGQFKRFISGISRMSRHMKVTTPPCWLGLLHANAIPVLRSAEAPSRPRTAMVSLAGGSVCW